TSSESKLSTNTDSENQRSFTRKNYVRIEKLSPGETISLNSTDTTEWKKIPGIGSSYSSRIVKYRALLGGFNSKVQLLEVYGINSEMYSRISQYITEDTNFTKIKINELEFKDLLRHPYLNYGQVQTIINLRDKKGNITSINELSMLDEFTKDDISRLQPYLDF
ncbi:MAG: helix-hairpin-helix domain-containing protein, partial [Bacteroidales bacterium]|nr:helix-hairpin-helix domain-containing protein [Bacteroidales bacterium]